MEGDIITQLMDYHDDMIHCIDDLTEVTEIIQLIILHLRARGLLHITTEVTDPTCPETKRWGLTEEGVSYWMRWRTPLA